MSSEYQYLRLVMSQNIPLSVALDFEVHGQHIVYFDRRSRAKRPACIVQSPGPRPMAPSADYLTYEQGVTTQLFQAGVDDDVAGEGEGTSIWIESQGRTLRL